MSKVKFHEFIYHDVCSKSYADQWDTDNTYTTRSLETEFTLVKNEKDFYDLEVPFPIKKNKIYFLLWATYSSGDSFHFAAGDALSEFIDLFKSKEKAEKAREAIYKQHQNKKSTNGYCYKREDGTEVKNLFAPWDGYFEDLEKLEVVPVKLK